MNLLNIFLRPIIFLIFYSIRFINNSQFEYNFLKKRKVLKFPIIFLFKFIKKVIVNIKVTYINYAISKYKYYIKNHYETNDGSGHFVLSKYSNKDKKNYYNKKQSRFKGDSRLEECYKNFNDIINIKNGHSFLDVACGYGRDIKFLINNFNRSKITGFDINKRAIDFIKSGINNKKVKIFKGNFSDKIFLKKIKNNSYDWVIFSHALTFILDKDISQTLNKRIVIIQNLINKAKKGLILLENYPSERYTFDIEQNNRATFNHDIASLFNKNKNGKLIMLKNKNSFCFFFKKKLND